MKKKITSIRTIYTRERGNVKSRSGDGAEDVYVPKWVHFKRFCFLDDLNHFITAKQSISNLQKEKIMMFSLNHNTVYNSIISLCNNN